MDDFENEMDYTDPRLDDMEFDEESYPQGFDEDYDSLSPSIRRKRTTTANTSITKLPHSVCKLLERKPI